MQLKLEHYVLTMLFNISKPSLNACMSKEILHFHSG